MEDLLNSYISGVKHVMARAARWNVAIDEEQFELIFADLDADRHTLS